MGRYAVEVSVNILTCTWAVVEGGRSSEAPGNRTSRTLL